MPNAKIAIAFFAIFPFEGVEREVEHVAGGAVQSAAVEGEIAAGGIVCNQIIGRGRGGFGLGAAEIPAAKAARQDFHGMGSSGLPYPNSCRFVLPRRLIALIPLIPLPIPPAASFQIIAVKRIAFRKRLAVDDNFIRYTAHIGKNHQVRQFRLLIRVGPDVRGEPIEIAGHEQFFTESGIEPHIDFHRYPNVVRRWKRGGETLACAVAADTESFFCHQFVAGFNMDFIGVGKGIAGGVVAGVGQQAEDVEGVFRFAEGIGLNIQLPDLFPVQASKIEHFYAPCCFQLLCTQIKQAGATEFRADLLQQVVDVGGLAQFATRNGG